MLAISGNRVTNAKVSKIGENQNIIRPIHRRKSNWISHLLRRKCVKKTINEGHIVARNKNLSQLTSVLVKQSTLLPSFLCDNSATRVLKAFEVEHYRQQFIAIQSELPSRRADRLLYYIISVLLTSVNSYALTITDIIGLPLSDFQNIKSFTCNWTRVYKF